MKTYKTNNHTMIKRCGREKRINYTRGGDPYFNWRGRRVRFDTVLRSSYPTTYTDDDGKLGVIEGYLGISNCYGVLVEIIDGGEAVQLWEEVYGE